MAMLSPPNEIAPDALVEPLRGVWPERLIALAYGSTVSLAMLGCVLGSALCSGIGWVLS
ncbi:hypothetical protein [Bradyrhizobium sp. B117]|uniref:hypothetical protein n=1 Tax=Bradyrhizobium sp. B117 TaxID=3140246 RepID=UPI0031842118